MADTLSAQTAPQTTAEYEAEFELLMQEAARLNELMAKDRVEIELKNHVLKHTATRRRRQEVPLRGTGNCLKSSS